MVVVKVLLRRVAAQVQSPTHCANICDGGVQCRLSLSLLPLLCHPQVPLNARACVPLPKIEQTICLPTSFLAFTSFPSPVARPPPLYLPLSGAYSLSIALSEWLGVLVCAIFDDWWEMHVVFCLVQHCH